MSTPTEDDLMLAGASLSAAVDNLADAKQVLSGYQQTLQQYKDLVASQQLIVKDARKEVRRHAKMVADTAALVPAEEA